MPFTAQPSTATSIGSSYRRRRSSISATTVSMSNWSRPQVGQAISTGPRSRSLSALRISQATLTSSSAWKVESEMRIVSPMPSASSVPRPTADLSEPDHLVPGLGDAEVERVVDLLREQAVRGDRVRHVRRLDRDLEVLEAEPVHELHVLQRGGHERLDGVLALELVEVLGKRAGVDADPHRHAGLRALSTTWPTLSCPPMLPGLMRMQ